MAKANSATGTRTRVARVRAKYPNQLDYSGDAKRLLSFHTKLAQLHCGLEASLTVYTSLTVNLKFEP